MQFGMPTLIENQTLEDNISLCSKLGIDFIELNMNFPEYQIDKLENTEFFLKKANEAGIYYTIHLDENLNIADFNPLVTEAYLETVRRTIAVAKRLSAPVINMHMNHGIYITLPDRKVQMYDRNFDVYMESFKRFREMCEGNIGEADIRITIENTDGFRTYEKKAIEYLLESPVFALTWDIGHSKAVGETDESFLMAHEDRLLHFHIHDGITSTQKNHLALGDGEIPLEERLQLANRHGCRCVVETKTIEALCRSVRWVEEYGFK